MTTSPTDNAEQIAFWNGAAARRWLDLDAKQDVVFAPITEALFARARLAAGERVLDVGCGGGGTTIDIAGRVGPTGSAVGLDVSRPLLEAARRRAPPGAPVDFILADAVLRRVPAGAGALAGGTHHGAADALRDQSGMKTERPIESLILTLRGQKVILAGDLAGLYGVPTRRLNEQVKRNAERFPEDFLFPLTAKEFVELQALGAVTADGRAALRSQIAILKRGQHAKYPPHAFTEHGAIMAATVLNSPEAVRMSVYVVRAFIQMREQIAANAAILKRLAEIDKSLLDHDQALRAIWTKLQPLLAPPPPAPTRRIGFHVDDK